MSLYQLDLTTYNCPLPVLMTKKALEKLPMQSTLVVYLSLLSSSDDFKRLCEHYGYQWGGAQQDRIKQIVVIKK